MVQRRVNARELAELRHLPLWVRVRAGLHSGDVGRHDADIPGMTVSIAARLEAAAPPGGILLSREAFATAGPLADVAVRDLGAWWFRNVDRPVHAVAIAVD